MGIFEDVCVLFFFFKQKTAYEMRISDWRSDVCSSDLVTLDSALRPAQSRFTLGPFQLVADAPLTAPLTVSGTLQRAGPGYDLAGVLGLDGGQALVDLSGRYGDDGHAHLEAVGRPKIGRASCRERVCQYVYISWVAYTLKKKKLNNNGHNAIL